jgi:hypothetical protein
LDESKVMDYCSDFKYDLEVGQVKEKELAEILQGKTIEVKRDLMTKHTGNVFIEYEWEKSGIAKTKADFYCIAIEDVFIILPTNNLKDIVRPFIGTNKDVKGGDDDLSKGILLPLKILIKLK